MQQIPREQVERRLQVENPWWSRPDSLPAAYAELRPRAYFELLLPLVRKTLPRRAVLLMGPRRVGKTVLLHQIVRALINAGVNARNIAYVSVDHPLYHGCGLEDLVERVNHASGIGDDVSQRYVIFDEIQYLREWEVHLKTLVDAHANIKFIASGSAAAALRLKSNESGAGRFTDFLLPPLTFHEYLDLLGSSELAGTLEGPAGHLAEGYHAAPNVSALNDAFLHYLNFGGYPEVIFSPDIQADPGRFIKADIIDKVLLRDLPGLYGIQDIQELNYLFTVFALNTSQEVSLEEISKNTGVAKNTIKRYIEYLEAAFLLKTVHRVDRNAKRFQRANFFKVYLTNTSLRAALFSPVSADDPAVGALAETGILSQWFHHSSLQYYARWKEGKKQGEVDIVGLNDLQKPDWAVEVKWSDRFVDAPHELRSLIQFCEANELRRATVTTRSRVAVRDVGGLRLTFVPASTYCYTVGYNLMQGKHAHAAALG